MKTHTANKATESRESLLLNRHRGSHRRFDVHARQGVADRHALSPTELRAAASDLSTKAASGRTAATGVAIVIGAIVGLHPHKVCEIPFIDGPPEALPDGIGIVFGGRAVAFDLDRLLERADAPDQPDRHRPASRITCTPLPQFVADYLAAHRDLISANGTGAAFAGCRVPDRLPLTAGPGVRLRITFTRFRHSLAPRLRDLGIPSVVAAILLADWEACVKSNLAYLTVPAEAIQAAARTLYDSLGWGPPATIDWNRATGSLTTPTRQAVAELFSHLRSDAAHAHPGRNCGWSRLIHHHNLFTKYTVGFVQLGGAARATAQPDLDFSVARQGAWFTPFDDKAASPIQRDRPMLLSKSVARQLVLYRFHSLALHRRIARIEGPCARHLHAGIGRLIGGQINALFFRINDATGNATPVGSHFIFDGLDKRLHLSDDFGRHYFGTALFDAGLGETYINHFLRHAAIGVEGLSSTSHLSLSDAFSAIEPVIESELAGLGIAPLPGLSERA